jgi:hypothetical protein
VSLKPFGELIRDRSAFCRSIKQNTDVGQRCGLSEQRLHALAGAFNLIKHGQSCGDSCGLF